MTLLEDTIVKQHNEIAELKARKTNDKEKEILCGLADCVERLLEMLDDHVPYESRDSQQHVVFNTEIKRARTHLKKAEPFRK